MKLHSFIQFEPNQRLNTNAKIKYFDAICLKPFEWYCQTIDVELTNTDLVEVVDCNGVVLEEVVYFTSGLFFEFVLQNEYYQQIRLKATTSNSVYFSNPFVCYENELTLRFDYKLNDFYQSIRVQGIRTTMPNTSQVDTYVESRGIELSGYSTLTTRQNYIFDHLDNFTVLAINEALAYETIYIDGIRITNKPLLKDGEINGQTNQLQSETQGAVDLFDVYEPSLQIAPPLQLISATPQGIYTINSFGVTVINGFAHFIFEFNYPINVNSFGVVQLTSNGCVSGIFGDPVINNNVATYNTFLTLNDFSNCEYQITIPENTFFNNIFGSHSEIIINFEIRNADFDGNDFNNNDFFAN